MEKIIYAVMATAAMPTCVFAQQTENSNESCIVIRKYSVQLLHKLVPQN